MRSTDAPNQSSNVCSSTPSGAAAGDIKFLKAASSAFQIGSVRLSKLKRWNVFAAMQAAALAAVGVAVVLLVRAGFLTAGLAPGAGVFAVANVKPSFFSFRTRSPPRRSDYGRCQVHIR